MKRGLSYIGDVPALAVREALQRFEPTMDPDALRECDYLIMAVPTPLTESREPSLAFVEAAARTVRQVLRWIQIVILESTTYPGTTDEVLRPRTLHPPRPPVPQLPRPPRGHGAAVHRGLRRDKRVHEYHVVNLVERGLKERGRGLAGSTGAILRIAYKEGHQRHA